VRPHLLTARTTPNRLRLRPTTRNGSFPTRNGADVPPAVDAAVDAAVADRVSKNPTPATTRPPDATAPRLPPDISITEIHTR
jgi:hypothetical protein